MPLHSLSIAVLDDEKDIATIVADSVSSLFASHHVEVVLSRFSDSLQFIESLPETPYDLAFLDIDMPKIDGVEVARRLHRISRETAVVFVSNREDKVFETFEVQPFGFVRKSSFLNDIAKVVSLYLIELERKREPLPKLIVDKAGNATTIPLDNVLYIECERHSQIIHLLKKEGEEGEDTFTIHDVMAHIEETTAPYGFRRVHKGFIVNLRQIQTILNDGVLLQDGSFIPINRKRIGEFKQQFLKESKMFGPVFHSAKKAGEEGK